ncbi:MAG: HDOD domain-containing protein [Thermogutta sp.]|uniref:HDOD domain-containing protein n=1 Tax=Thermogutta sp. TaxID=1962930 RepID=UPI0019CDD65F|nr:HDOD domain-containing protein [Thermogutta sp.]MBC7352198.1 HDOD domain-containing protein [Thermogutta sp.]
MTTVSSSTGSPLESVVRRVHDISTIPQVALRVLEVANDPDSSASDLKEVMETDAALSARVLRYVNSSAYAVRTRITNLQQAIAYLGMKQIRNIALTASVAEMFRNDMGVEPYRRSNLWKHLVSVGICARLIAMRCKIAAFEDAFLAGLLHDIGIILEDQYVHPRFRQMIMALTPEKSLCEWERQFLGFDHAELGEAVARAWGFPENVRTAIAFHHNAALYRGEQINIIRCVAVANLICTLKGMPSVGINLVRVPTWALQGLSLTKADIAVLAEDLDREIAQNALLYEL